MDQSASQGAVSLRIKEFYVGKIDARNPTSPVVDWVSYYPVNGAGQTLVNKRVADILSVPPLDDPQNPLLVMANQRKRAIEPAYLAWKAGSEVPMDGLPLVAWTALSKQQVEIILHSGIKTVEQLADALDSTVATIKLPNPQDLRTMAQRYVASKDAVKASQRQAELEDLVTQQREQLSEMGEMMRELRARLNAQMQQHAPVLPASDDEGEAPVVPRGSRRRNRPVISDVASDDDGASDEAAAEAA